MVTGMSSHENTNKYNSIKPFQFTYEFQFQINDRDDGYGYGYGNV